MHQILSQPFIEIHNMPRGRIRHVTSKPKVVKWTEKQTTRGVIAKQVPILLQPSVPNVGTFKSTAFLDLERSDEKSLRGEISGQPVEVTLAKLNVLFLHFTKAHADGVFSPKTITYDNF